MTAERTEVAVVGGGQAGLAAGYFLRRAGVPFLILDGADRVGDSWRRRWDSLELFTTARYSALPGLDFPGDPELFPGKDAVGDYLESYAREFDLPLRLGTRVTGLERADDGYVVETSTGRVDARQVVVAAGAYQSPYVPPLSAGLAPQVTQLHSSAYRNPRQIAARDVVVVGSSNSGAQIARDLAATHRVRLSRGRPLRRFPRRILGRSLHWWGDRLGLIDAPLDSLRGRTQRGDLLIGTSLRQLARRHGVELAGRAVAARGRELRLDDGSTLTPGAIVWATGFRPDYSWISVPILDRHGAPIHRRGVTGCRGLYFLGMHGQHSRGSSLIGFVKEDAAFIVDRVRVAAG